MVVAAGWNNFRTIIVTAYFPMVGASSGGAYSQQLEVLTTIKIKNYPRAQFWIYLNTNITKYMDHGEQLILMGDWNSRALEVNTWIETQGLTNTICDIHSYSDILITYQRSKECPINGIYCADSLSENRGGFLSFGILVGYHRDLWI